MIDELINELAKRFRANDEMLVDIVEKVKRRFETDEKAIADLQKVCVAQGEAIMALKKDLDNLTAEYYLLGPKEK
jgi:hypothetical protein